MSNFQAGVGRTDLMCSLPSISDPMLTQAASDSPPIDPIHVMFERLFAGMARIEARMDDYDRRPPSARHTSRPEPDPPDSRPLPRSLEAALPSALHLPATSPFMDFTEGFRPNPSGASGSRRAGPTQRMAQQELQSTWDLPPASRPTPAWDVWGSRFGYQTSQGVRSAWDPPGHRHPASLPIADKSSPWLEPDPPYSGASGSRRTGPAERLIQQELQSPWDLPPASRPHSAWDNWGNRFSEPHVYSGGSSWDSPGQRQPAHMDVNVPHIPPFSEISSTTPSFTDPYSQPQYYTDPYTDPYCQPQLQYYTDPYTDPPPAMLPAAAPPYTVDPYYVNNIGVSPAVVHNVVVHVPKEPVLIRVQENIVSERSTSSAEEVVSGELYTLPENGDLPAIQDEDVHVSKNVVEARDEAVPVIENPTIIDEAPKKSYAPIAMHLKVTTATLSRFPASVFVPFLKGKKVFVPFIDMSSTAGIEPHSVNVYGNIEGSRSIIRWAFDPGGVISPKLLFRTLFVVSWFPP